MSNVASTPDILHLDMDCFFASVEVLETPSLRGRPVIVGGGANRGVVSAASYEARAYGVRSAMPIREALRLCPMGVFLPPRHAHYAEVSEALMAICRETTPLVEPLSLDEAYLDVTGAHRLLGDSQAIATRLRASVLARLELRCSVGVGRTKLIAKLASRAAKPVTGLPGSPPGEGRGVVVISLDEESAFLDGHLVRAIPGIGPQTAASLSRIGIDYVRDLAGVPLEQLVRRFGQSRGTALHEAAVGIDRSVVVPDRETRSISQERTFETDVVDRELVRSAIRHQADTVMRKSRESGLVGRTVTLKIRYADFTTLTRSTTERTPFRSAAAFARIAASLFDDLQGELGIRLVGVALSSLEISHQSAQQLEMFPSEEASESEMDERRAEADAAADEVRRRFGDRSISLGDRRLPSPIADERAHRGPS